MLRTLFQRETRRTRGRRASMLVRPQEPIRIGPAAQPEIVVGPQQVTVIEPLKSLRIEPPRRGAWDEKGWQRLDRNGHRLYTGMFRARQRASGQEYTYAGCIEIMGRVPTPFIANPPAGLSLHPKAPCFEPLQDQNGWYRVHWRTAPDNVDDAIIYVERVLSEVLNRGGRS